MNGCKGTFWALVLISIVATATYVVWRLKQAQGADIVESIIQDAELFWIDAIASNPCGKGFDGCILLDFCCMGFKTVNNYPIKYS